MVAGAPPQPLVCWPPLYRQCRPRNHPPWHRRSRWCCPSRPQTLRCERNFRMQRNGCDATRCDFLPPQAHAAHASELNRVFAAQLADMQATHAAQLQHLRQAHEATIAASKAAQQAELSAVRQAREAALDAAKGANDAALAALAREQAEALREMKAHHEEAQAELVARNAEEVRDRTLPPRWCRGHASPSPSPYPPQTQALRDDHEARLDALRLEHDAAVAAARERWAAEVARADADGRTALTQLHATFGAAFAAAADASALLTEAERLRTTAHREKGEAAAEREQYVVPLQTAPCLAVAHDMRPFAAVLAGLRLRLRQTRPPSQPGGWSSRRSARL